MDTIEFLSNPALRWMVTPGLAAGVALATVCAALSPFVVLKKYAFVGQGVSHCAFGGVGVAALLGLGASAGALEGALWYLVVAAFCIAAAVGMGLISDRKTIAADTAIGVFLVASMALGAVLLALAMPDGASAGAEAGEATVHAGAGEGGGVVAAGWESILFGQILFISPVDAWVTAIVGAAVLGVMWLLRRPLIFWAFDEATAPAFGVSAVRMRLLMMVLLALAVVTAMKVVGVVLPTAMLVLPGATALSLGPPARRSLSRTIALSWLIALLALATGFAASIELDLPTGASIVLALTVIFAAVRGVRIWR